eukprot:s3156_g7.t1
MAAHVNSEGNKPVMLLATVHQSACEELGLLAAQLEEITLAHGQRDRCLPGNAIQKIEEAKCKVSEALQIVARKTDELHAQVRKQQIEQLLHNGGRMPRESTTAALEANVARMNWHKSHEKLSRENSDAPRATSLLEY